MATINSDIAKGYKMEIWRGPTMHSPDSFEIQLEEEKDVKVAFCRCHFFDVSEYLPITFNHDVIVRNREGKIVFSGYIAEIPRVKEGPKISFEFNAFSTWYKSQNIVVNKTYTNTYMYRIVEDLMDTYGTRIDMYKGQIDETNYLVEEYKIEDKSLWEAINDIAELINFNVRVDSTTLNFTRYTNDYNWNPLQEGNYEKGSANFQETTNYMVNRLIVLGDDGARVVVEDAESINDFGVIEKTKHIRNISKEADLIEYGNKHLEQFARPIKTGQITVFDAKDWKANQLIQVHIPELNLNGDWLRISRIRKVIDKGYVKAKITFNVKNQIGGTMAEVMKKLRDATKKEKELNEKITQVDTKVQTHESSIQTHETSIQTHESNITDLDTRVQTLETGGTSGGTSDGTSGTGVTPAFIFSNWLTSEEGFSSDEMSVLFNTDFSSNAEQVSSGISIDGTTGEFLLHDAGIYEVEINLIMDHSSSVYAQSDLIHPDAFAMEFSLKTMIIGWGYTNSKDRWFLDRDNLDTLRSLSLRFKSVVGLDAASTDGVPLKLTLTGKAIRKSSTSANSIRTLDYLSNLYSVKNPSTITIKKIG
ncbi:hypothetical protein FZC84_21275 [Rossellomorea vietnamensis]|uniref:YqbQ/XkdQ domain-containing protein n=1 Tax=Rossellomorea vietnamensis TaxID=218284 RepID=A0A5D4M263_9BACI|nr:hypothetical protein [Rossellomorea vietnamensis]TYR95726.1 hypothetical protein FZC84_21275 [Rossellomorea vietnamensis]